MGSKYWVNVFSPLLTDPGGKIKVCDLPYGSIVERIGDNEGLYLRVAFQAAKRFEGWIHCLNIEYVTDTFPPGVVQVPESDYLNWQRPAQYIVWNGRLQYNLCGEFCVSYIFGDDILTIRNPFLSKWKSKPTSLYNRVFSGGLARGTSAGELVDMVSVFGRPSRSIAETLRFENRIRWSPAILRDWIEDHYAIIGVKIETQRGELRRSGTLHWVVLDRVFPDGIGRGWVELYNPFPNQIQRYSWNEFTESVGIPYGIFVERRNDE